MRYAEPNAISGDENDIEYKRLKDDAESYVFSEGAGDCLAGCIDRRYWTVTVDENGGLSLKKSDDGGEKNRQKPSGAPRTIS